MDTKGPAIGRIVWTDYTTFLATMFVVLITGAFLYDRFIQRLAISQELPYFLGGIVIVALPIILWRIRLIASAFEFGWDVEGNILDVSFFRDRGRVTYTYTVQGERYQSSNAIMKNKPTRALQSGQKVTIVAQRDNPKVAFIRELYS